MKNAGVVLKSNSEVKSIEESAGIKTVHYKDGSTGAFDCVLYAIGRTPRSNELNLESTGLKANKHGYMDVD